jgi:hypothetical protein
VKRPLVFMNSVNAALQCFSPVSVAKKPPRLTIQFSTSAISHAARYSVPIRRASPFVRPHGSKQDKKHENLARKNSGQLRILRQAFAHPEVVSKRVRSDGDDPLQIPHTSWDEYNKQGSILPEQVIYLKALNGNLIPEDFVRTITTGGQPYIRGTHSVFSFAAKLTSVVIPIRSVRTLERDGSYLVVFKSAEDATQWRKHVVKLSGFTNKYTMTSLLHPNVVPGPGFLIHGVDVYDMVRQFTLLPAESRLQSNWSQQFSVNKNFIVQRGGYTETCNRDGRIPPRVLIRVFGVKITQQDLLQALLGDSIRRNMAWDLALNATDDITSSIYEVLKSKHQENQYSGTNFSTFGDGPYGDGQAWIIQFSTRRGAHQFARAWHGLPFPFPKESGYKWKLSPSANTVMNQGKETKVETEVLW